MSTKVDFAIVTPLEEERLAMLAHLPTAQLISGGNRDPRIYYKTKLPVFRDGKEGVYDLVISDLLSMGRVDAAIVAKDLMRRWSPRYILLVGIAGGLQRAGVRVGDVLIADKIVDPEQQKLTGKGREIRWSPHLADPCMLEASNQLTPDHWQANNGRPQPGQSRRHIGTVCTGDKVVADGSLDEYVKTWPRLIGVEMEAGGVASAAFQSVPAPGFFMVRGVSDLADAEKDSTGTHSWREYACKIAACYAAALLKSAPVPLNGSATARSSREQALICPQCGKRTLKIHSRSQNEFVLVCEYCSTMAMTERIGSKIVSFVVPGVISLVGFEVINDYLREHGGSIVDCLFDILNTFADMF